MATVEHSTHDHDVIIIGSGSAGMAAAIRASELGATAAIVERAEVVGGTCVNVGCIPSKYLLEVAHHVHAARTGLAGVAPCDPAVAWREVLDRKTAIIERLRQERYLDVVEAHDGVSLVHGPAEILDGRRVRVGQRLISGRKIIVATGTRPAAPPVAGLDRVAALDSTSVMELERLPESMIVVGGGSVGLELGQAFSRLGVRVTVVEAMDRILPNEDASVSHALAAALRAERVEVRTGVTVTRVSCDASGYIVELEQGGRPGAVRAEQLLVATGRRANTDGLGLRPANVTTDQHGFVVVDAFMRTSNPDVFAAGDVTGGPGYVYVAAAQGATAAEAALAGLMAETPAPIDLAALPRVTFTDPQVAAVGMTETEATSAGLRPEIASLPVELLSRAHVAARRHGVIRLLSEPGTDRLLGVHVVAPNAGDIIGEAVLAIRFGLTTRDLVSTFHPYLTWGEGLKLAAQSLRKDVAKLSCCA